MKRKGREGTKREAGRERERWGMSRVAGLGRDEKTTEREPSREVKRDKRGGGYCRGILTDKEEVMLHHYSNEVDRQIAPSNGTCALSMCAPSCPLLSRELTADKREKPITAKFPNLLK